MKEKIVKSNPNKNILVNVDNYENTNTAFNKLLF